MNTRTDSSPLTPRLLARGAGLRLALCLLLLFGAAWLASENLLASETQSGLASGPQVSQWGVSDIPEYSQQWRFGVGVDRASGAIDNYDLSSLCLGWYSDWGTLRNPPRPGGMEYMQLIRLRQLPGGADAATFDWANYNWADLNAKIDANPGSVWMIGNEPDGYEIAACDWLYPADYARIYKIFYDHIKGRDPTAKIANGAIIQGSPIRMEWLTRVWDAYKAQNGGQTMPVDVWNMHQQLVWERPGEGAGIPMGGTLALARDMTFNDVDSIALFREFVERMRQWMKDHGQQDKPLILSEWGIMHPERNGFTVDRVNEYMTASVLYLLNAKDPSLGMPGDEYRLVQRWAWYSLNVPEDGGGGGTYNSTMFDPVTRQITEFGRNYARLSCNTALPTPTPSSTRQPAFARREAEGGSLHGIMVTGELSSASDCRYVSAPATGGDVTFHVYAPDTGDYVIWGRVLATDPLSSFLVRVNDGTAITWDLQSSGDWQWRQVNSTRPPYAYPMIYTLQGKQWHKIVISTRNNSAVKLDMIEVTANRAYVPGASSVTVCNPITPTPTNSPTPTITRTPTVTPTPTVTRTPMPTGPARITGEVALQGRGTPPAGSWQIPLQVTAHLPGDPIPAYQFEVDADTQGRFTVASGILTGTYDVGVRNLHSLRNLRTEQALTVESPHLNMGALVEGDANLDNRIDILDFSLLASAYGARAHEAQYDHRVDFNGDGVVDILDLSLLASNYGSTGPRVLAEGAAGGQVQPQAQMSASPITLYVDPSTSNVATGGSFEVTVRVNTGITQVHSIEFYMPFSTAYLETPSIEVNYSVFGLVMNADVTAGQVHYVGAKTGSAAQGQFSLFKLTFQAKQTSGTTYLNFTGVRAILVIGEGDNKQTVELLVNQNPGTVVIQGATATPTRTQTPIPSATPVYTAVPNPTPTRTREAGVEELVLRQDVNGYTGFVDTFISDYPEEMYNNYHTDWYLRLRGGGHKRILFSAQLPDPPLPPGTIIESATLTLYQLFGADAPLNSQIYEVLRGWSGPAATWITATQGLQWGTWGCDQPGVDRAVDPFPGPTIFPTWRSYPKYPFNFDVTDLVRQWVNDPSSNNGLMIHAPSPNVEFVFGSSDNGDIESRPKLTIRYRVGPTPTPTSTVTPGPSPTPTLTPTASPTPTQTLIPTVTPTPSPTTVGSISGRVFEDVNLNSEPDAGEPGVDGVTVELRDAFNQLLDTRVTAQGGYYTFADIAAGSYRVRLQAAPEGYTLIDPSVRAASVEDGQTTYVHFALSRPSSPGLALPLVLRNFR